MNSGNAKSPLSVSLYLSRLKPFTFEFTSLRYPQMGGTKTMTRLTQYSAADPLLLTRLAAGDREAFAELHNRYFDGLYNYQVRFTGNPALIEDLVRDIFMKIWKRRESLKTRLIIV